MTFGDCSPLGRATARDARRDNPPRGAVVLPDMATCDACLRELFDPSSRRYRYPFLSCAECGPRFTIADVARETSHATGDFEMCDACRRECEDPSDRRFGVEPNACAACGPRVALFERGAYVVSGEAAISAAIRRLLAGAIVAVKGLGGFQLAVDHANDEAVSRLRQKKRAGDEPFALMVKSLDEAAAIAEIDEVARAALGSKVRPIVLLAAARGVALAKGVAPAGSDIGVMLPSTPLHHLLLEAGPPVLAMTSGRLGDEPVTANTEEALEKLAPLADSFLVHDRRILARADESIVRVVAGATQAVRRGRGMTPEAIALGFEGPSVLGVGADLENTVCITRGGKAHLSQHVGDLARAESRDHFADVIANLSRAIGEEPTVVAHDLHPMFASSR